MEALTVKDVMALLKIGRDQAYALFNSKAFPSFRIGKKMLITKDAFNDWLVKMQNKTIVL